MLYVDGMWDVLGVDIDEISVGVLQCCNSAGSLLGVIREYEMVDGKGIGWNQRKS